MLRITVKQPMPLLPKPIKMADIEDVGEGAQVLVAKHELGAQCTVHIVGPVPLKRESSTTVPFVRRATCNTMILYDDIG